MFITALTADQHYMAARMCQIAAIQARISYWQSMLSSGAYLDRNIRRLNGIPLTPKEKRDEVLETLERLTDQLQKMQDFHEEAAVSRFKEPK